MVTATVDIVQWYCVVLEFIVVKARVDIVQWYSDELEFIMVRAKVDIVQWYCAVCGEYCGYRNSRYSAMVLCCVWSLFW